MAKFIRLLLIGIIVPAFAFAQSEDSLELSINDIEESFNYQTGVIELKEGNGKLTVPKGFRYLDPKQTTYILSELWNNPVDSSILGCLVPENRSIMEANSWLFTINYEDLGYVKDDDAEDIDYDDLLSDLKEETDNASVERVKMGYPSIQLINWASNPYYDKDKKVLHWAKEYSFGGDSLHTLNYNLRVLGRKGVYVLNAVALMSELKEVKSNISKVITSIEFEKGNKYSDFDPDVDEVAAWTIGGLVAGKILAKTGILAILIKSWKLIALALMAAGGSIWRFITGKKKEGSIDNSAVSENNNTSDNQ